MTDQTTTYPAAAINHPEWTPGQHWHHKKRFSGKAIIAGIATALAVEIVLGLIGTAIGLGVAGDPKVAVSETTATLAVSMWAAASVIVSVFYGAFIAARLSNNTCHHMGILHGIVAWAGVVLIFAAMTSSLTGGAFQIMGKHTVQVSSTYDPDAQKLSYLEKQGLSPQDAQARVNDEKAKAKADAEKAAREAAKTAAGAAVVLLLAGFVAGLGGSLGALHVKHHDRDEHRTDIKV